MRLLTLGLILFLAAAIRLYNIGGLNHFTYDQARDAIYIKRIIVDHKFRLIGTQSSIPGVYTPPLYYYMMTPFLLVFKLNPAGLDYATAIFGILSVMVFHFLLSLLIKSRYLRLAITSLYAFQPAIVAQSRYAWNPNTTPFFIILALISLIKIVRKETGIGYYLVLFFSLSMAISLHYSGLIFALTAFIFLAARLKNLNKKNLFFGVVVFFFLTGLPILLFDFRHDFVNTRGVFNYFFHNSTVDQTPPLPFFAGIIDKYRFLFGLVFPLSSNIALANLTMIFSALCLLLITVKKRNKEFNLFCWLFFFSIIFASFYKKGFFSFYLTFLYPLPFVILGQALALASKRKILIGLLSSVVMALAIMNFASCWRQVKINKTSLEERLSATAEFLSTKVAEPFNLAAINDNPERFGSNAVDYRYYLETFFGKKGLDWDPIDYQQADHLYLISEIGEVDPLKTGIWEVGLFKPKKVMDRWEIDKAIVYHLVK